MIRAEVACVQVERVLDGEIFSVDHLRFQDERGRAMSRLIVRHPGAVVVVPQLPDGRLVMIRNHRISVDAWLWEFCAGKLERGEDPSLAAGRELEEETGHHAGRIRAIGSFYTSPGFADELMHAFFADQLTPVPQRLEPGERIEVECVKVDQVESMIRDGRIRDGKTIAAFALWRLASP